MPDDIRWAILGCGDIARKRVAEAIQQAPHSQLAAVCRRDPVKLQQFASEFGVARATTEAAELITDAKIDAVYIATPVHLHAPQTIAAARAGKHVLVEKPMALNTAECDAMIDACRQADVGLGVAYYRRFYPLVARIKQLLEDGAIGRPVAVAAATSTPLEMTPDDDGYWRVLPEQGGGGALMDVGSHRLDLMLDWFGPIEGVAAHFDALHGDYEAEDTATLALRFASGMHGTLQCFFRRRPDCDSLTIYGTKGQLTADPLNGSQLQIITPAGQRSESHPGAANIHLPLIADFVAAIRAHRPPTITGEEGRAVNAAIAQAYTASDEK